MSVDPSAAIDPTAVVDEGAVLAAGVRVWHFSHVVAGARIGAGSSVGQGCFVAGTANVGAGVKIQNHVSVFDGVTLEDEVFVGPGATFTNVKNPRSAVPRKDRFVPTRVRRGATIGANATIVCGVTIGRYAFVAAGAVVTRDVADHALVAGVPAVVHGYVGTHGDRLEFDAEGGAICPSTGRRYVARGGAVLLADDDPAASEFPGRGK